MCVLCQAQQGNGYSQFASSGGPGHIQYGAGSVATSAGTGIANTDALISGYKWAGSALTFALPAVPTALPGYDLVYDETGSFTAVTGTLATGIRMGMAHIGDYTGLTITETANAGSANLLIGRTGQTTTAHAYLPDGYFKGGDVWFGTSEDFDAPARGNYAYATVLHEIGHALGLKHAHTFIGGIDIYEDDVGIIGTPIASNRDSTEFTIMTYRSHIGQDLAVFDYYTNENASFPQTLMMYDIAALQKMYGADFNTNATSTVYTFSATTGEMLINGVSDGALAGNRIFRTIWDGGGTDTYDFSNFGNNQTIDLTPGGWSLMSSAQRADLGSGNFARANVFNALQFGSDARSLVENAIGGSGNDTIFGNMADNALTGGLGNDILTGGLGNDIYVVESNLDAVIEIYGQGTDTVFSSAAFTQLDAGLTLENLTYNGVASGTLYGNSLNNVLTGNNAGSSFNGFYGADTMVGGSGNDFFYADETDSVSGGTGYDAVYIQTANAMSFNIGAAQVEFVVGGTANDTLDGATATASLVLQGGAGADVIKGGAANDFLYIDSFDTLVDAGGGTNDVIVVTGNAGVTLNITAANGEYIIGGSGSDTLNAAGSAAGVVIQGGGGADTITGGNGNDYLFGNADSDVFAVTANAQFDAVFDFVHGADRIDVRGMGASFDTFAEVIAATTDYSGTSIIDFGNGNALYLYQVVKTNLTAGDFIFL